METPSHPTPDLRRAPVNPGPCPSTHTYRLLIFKERSCAIEAVCAQTVMQQQRGSIVARNTTSSTAKPVCSAGRGPQLRASHLDDRESALAGVPRRLRQSCGRWQTSDTKVWPRRRNTKSDCPLITQRRPFTVANAPKDKGLPLKNKECPLRTWVPS